MRIGWQNLINFGIIPFQFKNANDYIRIRLNDILSLSPINKTTLKKNQFKLYNETQDFYFDVIHSLSERQIEIIISGGMINYIRKKNKE
jgi:aconitate hydratase